MLTTSNSYSKRFLTRKRLFLDSCILNDWATDNKTKNILNEIEKKYSFIFCTISMLEVGFGTKDKADVGQVKIAKEIYDMGLITPIDSTELWLREQLNKEDFSGKRLSYNPRYHEYFAARTKLIDLMELDGTGGKKIRELQNDALIFFCAWNSESSIVTNNIQDFNKLNEAMKTKNKDHLLPIFSMKDLEESLSNNVSFPENIEQWKYKNNVASTPPV